MRREQPGFAFTLRWAGCLLRSILSPHAAYAVDDVLFVFTPAECLRDVLQMCGVCLDTAQNPGVHILGFWVRDLAPVQKEERRQVGGRVEYVHRLERPLARVR